MEKGGFGQILALVGLIVFILSGVGRRPRRGQSQPSSPTWRRWQQWGTLAAIIFIAAGLVLMATAR